MVVVAAAICFGASVSERSPRALLRPTIWRSPTTPQFPSHIKSSGKQTTNVTISHCTVFYDQCERLHSHRPRARQGFVPLEGSHGCFCEEVAHKCTDHGDLEIAYRAELLDRKLDTLHLAGTMSLCSTSTVA